jgi:hypothetical protein
MKLGAFALACLLAGCASEQSAGPPPAPATMPGPGSAGQAGEVGMGTPRPGGCAMGGSMRGGGMMGGMGQGSGAGMATMDQMAMCDLSRQIGNARTPEEREELLARVMPNMAPEVRERHVQMMRQRCDGRANAPPADGQ